eukprot:COSAG01_NODE_12385_length_1749_cov_1.793939_1_plen_369_part_01
MARAGDDDVDARDRLLAEISALESRPPGGDSATLESPPSRKTSAAARRRRAGARGGHQGKGLCRRCFLCGLNFELVVVGIVGLLMASKLAESPVQQQLHGHHGQVGRWLESSDSHAIFYIAMVAFSSIAIGLLGWGAVCSGNETAATCHFVAMLLLSCLSLWFVVFLAVSCCPVTLQAVEASLNTTHQLESGDNGCAGPGKSGGRTLSEGCWAELAGEEHAATGSSHDLHAAMSVRYERNLCHTQAIATQPTVGKVSKRVNLRARTTLVAGGDRPGAHAAARAVPRQVDALDDDDRATRRNGIQLCDASWCPTLPRIGGGRGHRRWRLVDRWRRLVRSHDLSGRWGAMMLMMMLMMNLFPAPPTPDSSV